MTVIEFFDKNPLENLVTTLTLQPDRVIFFGQAELMMQQREACVRLLREKRLAPEIVWQAVDCSNLPLLIETLTRAVEREGSCIIDVTGGEDLVLVAAGVVYEKLRKTQNLQVQKFDLAARKFIDCDGDKQVQNAKLPQLTVAQNIALRGGVIRYQSKDGAGTEPWSITADLYKETDLLWRISCRAPSRWNTAISILRGQERRVDETQPLRVTVSLRQLQKITEKAETDVSYFMNLLQELAAEGLLLDVRQTEEKISYTYRDSALWRLMAKAGNVLELKMLLLAKRMRNPDGSPWCTDAVNGVYIDWDGLLHTRYDEEKDTENEIDVLLMREIFPVFISCKNGIVKEEELYKLRTVSDRFGGKYTRCVLAATYLGKSESSNAYLRQRAADMFITLIENVHTMSDAEIEARLRAACER